MTASLGLIVKRQDRKKNVANQFPVSELKSPTEMCAAGHYFPKSSHLSPFSIAGQRVRRDRKRFSIPVVTLTPVPKLAGGSSGSTFSKSAGSSISPQG